MNIPILVCGFSDFLQVVTGGHKKTATKGGLFEENGIL